MGMTGGHRCLWTMVCLLHDLFCVTCPLHSNQGGEGTVTWGCEGAIAQRRIMYKGGLGATCWSAFLIDISFKQ